jgi:hypothetical protein
MTTNQDAIDVLEARITQLEQQLAGRDKSETPRWRLRQAHPSRRVAAIALTLALLLPGIALASHQFPDVTTSNPFHADIDAIVDAGIATGFQDGKFRPAEAVTRQAMSAFLHRGLGRVGLAIYDAPMTANIAAAENVYTSNNVYVPVRTITVTVPGESSNLAPKQFVLLHGIVVFNGKMDAATQGCPCQFTARVRDVAANTWSIPGTDSFVTYNAVSAGFGFSVAVDALFMAPPGARTYNLEVALGYRDKAPSATTFPLSQYSSLTVQTFPFGKTGTNAF